MGVDLRRMVEQYSLAGWPDLLLLGRLAEEADATGYLQISQRDLCVMCGTRHRSTIGAAIARLEATRELEVVRMMAGGKVAGAVPQANIYRVKLDVLKERAASRRTTKMDASSVGACNRGRSRSTTVAGRDSLPKVPETVADPNRARLGSATGSSTIVEGTAPVATSDGGQAAASAPVANGGVVRDLDAVVRVIGGRPVTRRMIESGDYSALLGWTPDGAVNGNA